MVTKRVPDYITKTVEENGALIVETGFGGKHPFIRFQINGEVRKFCFTGTASDHRSETNDRLDLRRLIRRTAEEGRSKKKVA